MEEGKLKIGILPNLFLDENKIFKIDEAINFCGKIAGVCYAKDGFEQIQNESIEKTNRRVNTTINSGHHSVYDHVTIIFNLQNIPKILAMVLNNEHQYTTSEKSARYTKIKRTDNSIITEAEEKLYNKWLSIFKTKIGEKYEKIFDSVKINKLAQENARYLVTVFMPTQMVYSTSLRQINYIASWMKKYIENIDSNNTFEKKLADSMTKFINELYKVNVLDERLMENEKYRSLSLFGNDLNKKQEYFSDAYFTKYKGTFAQLAQAHRHRTLDYQIELLSDKEYYIPPIIANDKTLTDEWLNDINSVKDVNPIGELILISESGKYEDFILKSKERLCTHAQLEIMEQTKQTLFKYKEELEKLHNPLADDIKNYCRGARCTFPDFDCKEICNFKEGKILTRKI